MASFLSAIGDKISGAVDAVTDAVKDKALDALCVVAEKEIEKYIGRSIEVDWENIPDDRWMDWIMKTGINSLCNEDTWDFLEKSSYNQRKVELWEKRKIEKIILRVEEKPDEDDHWIVCYPEWTEGSSTLYLDFYPHALSWSSDNTWLEPGYKRWWVVRDEIVFGLQLYQLPGKCFYKSDWLDDFEDVDPTGLLPSSTKKFKRWFQFRHWIIFWYQEAQWGWNYQWTTKPPKNPDGSLFSLDAVLKLPSMPSLTLPSIKLPSLPDVSMPSLPDMPSISMPSISAPSLSMPSLSAPDLSNLSMPKIPEKPKRPTGYWECHGYIELEGMKVKASGSDIIFSNAKITHFWENKDNETKERQRLVLKTTSSEQAESWKESLVASGCEEGDAGGGCCTVA